VSLAALEQPETEAASANAKQTADFVPALLVTLR
jgi:hypothetical protein